MELDLGVLEGLVRLECRRDEVLILDLGMLGVFELGLFELMIARLELRG